MQSKNQVVGCWDRENTQAPCKWIVCCCRSRACGHASQTTWLRYFRSKKEKKNEKEKDTALPYKKRKRKQARRRVGAELHPMQVKRIPMAHILLTHSTTWAHTSQSSCLVDTVTQKQTIPVHTWLQCQKMCTQRVMLCPYTYVLCPLHDNQIVHWNMFLSS